MKIRLASDISIDSIVDGPGLRAVIWTQGCKHNCVNCHNPNTHDFNGGYDVSIDKIIKDIKGLRLHRGITLSGGDPFEQPEPLIEICKAAKEVGLDVWAYTGYTFEELIDTKHENYFRWINLLEYIDTLVDGRFIDKKKNIFLRFRGSSNQRILDVKKSLKTKKAVWQNEYEENIEIAK